MIAYITFIFHLVPKYFFAFNLQFCDYNESKKISFGRKQHHYKQKCLHKAPKIWHNVHLSCKRLKVKLPLIISIFLRQ